MSKPFSAQISRELQRVSDDLMGDTIGVSQAMGEMREAFAKLEEHLDRRNYEEAAQMGYEELASGFVFLQRCLAGLQRSCNDRDAVIQELAHKQRRSFEEVAPTVHAVMPAMQLNPDRVDASAEAMKLRTSTRRLSAEEREQRLALIRGDDNEGDDGVR